MMLAANVVQLSLADPSKVGTVNIKAQDVKISLAEVNVQGKSGDYEQLAIHIDESWAGFNFK